MPTRDFEKVALGALLILLGSHNAFSKAGKAIHSFAGKYIAYGDSFYTCQGQYDWSWNMKVTHWNPRRPNDLQRLTGWLNGTGRNVSDAFWMHVVLDTRSNNMWKENAFVFHFPTGACSAVRKQIPDFFRVIFKNLSINDKKPCIIPSQLYEVDGEPVDWVFPNVPVMPYGMYRFRLASGPPGTNSKSPVVCLVVEAHVVPKVSS